MVMKRHVSQLVKMLLDNDDGAEDGDRALERTMRDANSTQTASCSLGVQPTAVVSLRGLN